MKPLFGFGSPETLGVGAEDVNISGGLMGVRLLWRLDFVNVGVRETENGVILDTLKWLKCSA